MVHRRTRSLRTLVPIIRAAGKAERAARGRRRHTERGGASMIEAASSAAWVVVPDEGSVIDALRCGDEGAFARLVDQYHPSLRRVARLYISDRGVADEVVQDTWLGVIQGIWAFERRSSLKTWIFRILINRAKARAARERRMVPFPRFDGDVDVAEAAVAPDRFHPVDHPTEPGRWTRSPPNPGA